MHIITKCAGKAPEKRITITVYKEEYERAIARLKTPKGQYMKKKRQSTVEPVFGSLTSFYGMRKINTLGINQANKVMMLAAAAYNLKKMLKFSDKKLRKAAQALNFFVFSQIDLLKDILSLFEPIKMYEPEFLKT